MPDIYLNNDEVRVQSQWLPKRAGGMLRSWVTSGQNLTTPAVSVDTLYAVPVYIPHMMRIDRLVAEVTTGAVGNMKIGLYDDSGGYPNVLLNDSGSIDTTTGGLKQSAIGLVVPQGFYWLATIFSATPNMRLETNVDGNCMNWLGHASATDTAKHTGISVAFAFAALSNPFTAGGVLATTPLPRVMVALGKDGHITSPDYG